MLAPDRVNDFFTYARARETIRQKKIRGDPHPLTDDPILAKYSFCNVHREDDKTTQWFARNVRDRLRHDKEAVSQATFIFRWFNTIPTGERLLAFNLFEDWHPWRCFNVLKDHAPWVTGAYMVKTPAEMSKLDGVVKCIQQGIDQGIPVKVAREARTLQQATLLWQEAPYIGPFMAYELATDLRWTDVLCNAEDINTWASMGPGAARGLDRLNEEPLRTRVYSQERWQVIMLDDMRRLLSLSRGEDAWPHAWEPWEMRTVEHTLCEYDKYERTGSGEGRPKGRYHGGKSIG